MEFSQGPPCDRSRCLSPLKRCHLWNPYRPRRPPLGALDPLTFSSGRIRSPSKTRASGRLQRRHDVGRKPFTCGLRVIPPFLRPDHDAAVASPSRTEGEEELRPVGEEQAAHGVPVDGAGDVVAWLRAPDLIGIEREGNERASARLRHDGFEPLRRHHESLPQGDES